ncbi:MAG TPA: two-component regulator propeller domain-containing protein [Chitinophagaceae bacterium]
MLLLCASLTAQQTEFVFTRFTRQNGLASSRARSILQDHQGFYWISSNNGLQRFDGKKMVSFRHIDQDSTSLPDNEVGVLMEDGKNRLWLSSGGKPCLYDPLHRRFIKIPVDHDLKSKFNIASFFEDNKGTLWLSSKEAGVFVFDSSKNRFRPYSDKWPVCFAFINFITQDKTTGFYWLNTKAGDLMVYDPERRVYYHYGNNPFGWKCFINPAEASSDNPYVDDNGILWLQAWNDTKGFFHFRFDIRKNELVTTGPGNKHLWGYLTDASGITWAYGSILGRYNAATRSFIEIPSKRNSLYGIDFNEVLNAYEDGNNNIWFLSNLGLYFCNVRQQYFTTYNAVWSTFEKKHVDGNFNGFLETTDGHIIGLSWGTDGLYFFDSAFNQISPLYGYNPADIKDNNYSLTWCGLQDSRGDIWIGCQSGRIMKIDPSRKHVSFIYAPEFENRTIRSIAEDAYGNIWFGTQRNVLVKWERSTNAFQQIIPVSDERYKPGWILKILPGKSNDIWVATLSAGLLHIDCKTDSIAGQFLPGRKDGNSISSEQVNDVIQFSADTLALLTARGIDLFQLSTRSFIHLAGNEGLQAEGVFAILKDNKNNIWFSTVDGISKIQTTTRRVHHYGAADGITEQDFQLSSASRLSNNTMVFGNTRGFVLFHPDQVKETPVPADVLITGFNIFNVSHSVDSMFRNGQQVRLRYSQNYITIGFSSPGSWWSNAPDYFYKLEGVDADWIKAGEAQEANYTYLPTGKYTFHVRSVSQDGISSARTTSFIIHISPPFWRTWWFVLLVCAATAALVYYIYLLRRNRRAEREVIRNRIARDLHDDVGSTLSTISMLSSMAKSRLGNDPVRTSEYIHKISDNSQRMMEAMDDIVWAIKADNDSMEKIVIRMLEFATSVMEAQDIELTFDVEDDVYNAKLNMEQRKDFFLIFKEAVNNAAKYSGGTEASVLIALRNNRVQMAVIDNGAGFNVMAADSGNGLGNMQKRAAALKGILKIESKPGGGTRVTLDFPA